jgi:CRISPR/Cas system-associated endonuclease Cas1
MYSAAASSVIKIVRYTAIESSGAAVASLEAKRPASLPELLLIEAREALAYFRVWKELKLGWRNAKHPIPRTWDTFEARSIENGFKRGRNNNARHPVNAILNYAYGVLETRLRIQAIADGYDPTIGILHTSSQDKASFVFSTSTPNRTWLNMRSMCHAYRSR